MNMEKNELSKNAQGGTEKMLVRLYSSIDNNILNEFQIIPTRVRELREDKFRILWCHDDHNDPESQKALSNEGWKKYHYIVFVSNYQMQNFLRTYNIPWNKCAVMLNAIEPIEVDNKVRNDGKIKLIYTSVPNRGLNILVPVFNALCDKHDNIELDVYSSFALYGWKERDRLYEEIFEYCEAHPKINYHGAVSNEKVRESLQGADIFAYPSLWPETSCLALIEAMSAKCVCVHPNYAALYETAANWTTMYHWVENQNEHASVFYQMLDHVINEFKNPVSAENLIMKVTAQKTYADVFYNWNNRTMQWSALLNSIIQKNETKELPKKTFVYSVGE